MKLDRARLEETLRALMAADVDYDIHKGYERDEETGEDTYHELVDAFLGHWEASGTTS